MSRTTIRAGLGAMTLALMLSSCADAPPMIDNLPNGRVRGDINEVSVQGGRWEALPLAVAHCARFSRSAQFVRLNGDRAVFRCVASGS